MFINLHKKLHFYPSVHPSNSRELSVGSGGDVYIGCRNHERHNTDMTLSLVKTKGHISLPYCEWPEAWKEIEISLR